MALNFEIQNHFGVLSKNSSGWTKELNYISWNDREAKFDIRDWSPDHEKMGKGSTLTRDEAYELYQLFKAIFED